MRLPRVRLTVRRMLALVAVVAVALFFTREFWDGLPPRFVVDGIPARIERLRPGMTWGETRDILGLEKSWLRGGTDARLFRDSYRQGDHVTGMYCVRPMRETTTEPTDGLSLLQSKAMIVLMFEIDPGTKDWQADQSTRLMRASLHSDSCKIVEMPSSR